MSVIERVRVRVDARQVWIPPAVLATLIAQASKSLDRWLYLMPVVVAAVVTIPFLGTRSLWLDEAWVTEALLHDQFDAASLNTTPVAFALVTGLVGRAFGWSEFGLRLLPCLAGLLSVVLTYQACTVAARSRLAGFVAATLLATNLVMLTYARMLKPYTADVLFAVLLVLLAARLLESFTPRRMVAYSVTLAVAPFFSFGAVFVGAGAALALAIQVVKLRDGKQGLAVLGVHVPVVATLVPYYLLFLRTQSSGQGLLTYWADGFPPGSHPLEIAGWLARQFPALAVYFFTPSYALLIAATAIVGLLTFLRHGGTALVLLAGPFAAVIAAAIVGVYPFPSSGRVVLFLVPLWVMLAGAGVAWLVAVSKRVHLRWIAMLIVLVSLVPALQLRHPFAEISGVGVEETRRIVRDNLLPQVTPGDVIWVYYGAGYAFQYYAPTFDNGEIVEFGRHTTRDYAGVQAIFGGIHRDAPQLYGSELMDVVRDQHPRGLWLVFGHVWPLQQTTEEELVVSFVAEHCGAVAQIAAAEGAALYKLDNVQCH